MILIPMVIEALPKLDIELAGGSHPSSDDPLMALWLHGRSVHTQRALQRRCCPVSRRGQGSRLPQ